MGGGGQSSSFITPGSSDPAIKDNNTESKLLLVPFSATGGDLAFKAKAYGIYHILVNALSLVYACKNSSPGLAPSAP